MAAVGADQVDRPVGALAHRAVPGRGRAGRRRRRGPTTTGPPGPAGCRRRPTGVRSRPAARRGAGPAAVARSRPGTAGPAAGATGLVEARLGQRVAAPRARAARSAASAGRARRWRRGSRRGSARAPSSGWRRAVRRGGRRSRRPPGPASAHPSARVPSPRSAAIVGHGGDRLGDQPPGQRRAGRPGRARAGRRPSARRPPAARSGRRGPRPGKECERRPASRVTCPSAPSRRAQRSRRRSRSTASSVSAAAAVDWASGATGSGRTCAQVCARSRSATSAGSTRPSQSCRPAITAATSSRTASGSARSRPSGKRAAQLRVVGGERPHQVQRRLGGGPAGDRVDADGQVGADLAERLGGVDVAAAHPTRTDPATLRARRLTR